MDYKELYKQLLLGREIELDLMENSYFISLTNWEDINYSIFDEQKKVVICEGGIDDIFRFKFGDQYCLHDNIEIFKIKYIL